MTISLGTCEQRSCKRESASSEKENGSNAKKREGKKRRNHSDAKKMTVGSIIRRI